MKNKIKEEYICCPKCGESKVEANFEIIYVGYIDMAHFFNAKYELSTELKLVKCLKCGHKFKNTEINNYILELYEN